MTLRFTLGETPLGALLVAATARGIAAIRLGDDPETLFTDFQRQVKNAVLVGGDETFQSWMAQLVGHISEPQKALRLPLDITNTVFQQRVWAAIAGAWRVKQIC